MVSEIDWPSRNLLPFTRISLNVVGVIKPGRLLSVVKTSRQIYYRHLQNHVSLARISLNVDNNALNSIAKHKVKLALIKFILIVRC